MTTRKKTQMTTRKKKTLNRDNIVSTCEMIATLRDMVKICQRDHGSVPEGYVEIPVEVGALEHNEFFKIDIPKRLKHLEDSLRTLDATGTCCDEALYLATELIRAGKLKTSPDLGVVEFYTQTGVMHQMVKYTENGMFYVEDRSNGIWKKILLHKWVSVNKPTRWQQYEVCFL